jgi:hypothetical protein
MNCPRDEKMARGVLAVERRSGIVILRIHVHLIFNLSEVIIGENKEKTNQEVSY